MSQESGEKLRLRVITSKQLLVDELVEAAALPWLEGEVGILPGHRPLILGLGTGSLSYRHGTKENRLSISGGYATISAREVIVFTELSQDEKVDAAEKG
jgi:F-type H+-transporting ATPase subunit epsilon